MPSKVQQEMSDLIPIFEQALTSHLQLFVSDPEVYGYAVLVGEDIDQCGAIAVTNRESDLSEYLGSEEEPEYRYIPDEWQHWHQDAFTQFNAKLDSVYEVFRSRCPDDLDVFEYNEDEMNYLTDVYHVYLSAMKSCQDAGAFGSIWYRVIWISDSDRFIIGKSFNELNEGRAIDEAGHFFPRN